MTFTLERAREVAIEEAARWYGKCTVIVDKQGNYFCLSPLVETHGGGIPEGFKEVETVKAKMK